MGWIKMDKLPNNGDKVLITRRVTYTSQDITYDIVREAEYSDGVFHEFDSENDYKADNPVVKAWMPYPEPYEEDTKDELDIDDAIKHLTLYQKNEEENTAYWADTYGDGNHEEQEICEKRASEYRQLVKWLNELKDYRAYFSGKPIA